ncbi:formate C-acetyltransferase/glycerol dehydratase family glycyl radical enzyme [Candidatus Heimdallarchaeota archaeon B3_Heim]|nr:MAG: formate C-acetyltransferase/glycerol dehydratase family glycyl radical enzyme [Candidatus Heimdallarchaeota archaeon B3_Heim]
MKDRIKSLREQSMNAQPSLSIERAKLLTDYYQSGAADKASIPVARAQAFKYILENKKICINEGELIIGERGPEPTATPTYPEICTHTLQDFEILNSREKISFSVNDEVKELQSNVITPFWKGRSIRDKIFAAVDPEWIESYNAGLFTEFMEQRAPGHTVGGAHLWTNGMHDFQKEIAESIDNLDFFNDPEALNKKEELNAMAIAAEALILFAGRYSKKAMELAKKETNLKRKKELESIANICKHVPANAPRNMWEALQHYWFIHLGVITELNTWDSYNPGRLDQNLYSLYQQDISNKTHTEDSAKELLQAFWIKFNNQPAPPKVGVTAEESNTYTDFCLINIGGVKEDGSNAVNELSYILLDVIEEMRLLQPSSMVQISRKSPDRFLKRAFDIIKTGYGQPSVFNTDTIIQELTRQGKSIIDARAGGASGCVEAGAFGKEAYILTGYFNIPKVLEITLNNGIDPNTGKLLGLQTGNPVEFTTFEELVVAFTKQMNYFIDIKIKGNNIIERLWAQTLPAPFMSLLTKDCIQNGKDYNDGGARYNSSYIQGVGLGSITDSLAAIKYNIYDNKNVTMQELLNALKSNFKDSKSLREMLIYKTPKFGNDDDYPDDLMKDVFEIYWNAIDGRPNTKGGQHRVNLLPTTVHVYFGRMIGALPDGRMAHEPLSEGVSPVQGADIKGPTAVIKSVAKIDHERTGGTLLNQKFSPKFLDDEKSLEKVAHLVRSYFKMDGHHIQFNVVSVDTLRDAQKHPDKYRNLIVRVAGYSDLFINLGIELQNEIINRTEHMSA